MIQPAQQTFTGLFTGLLVETEPGEGHRFTVGGATGSKWRLKGAQVVSANPSQATGEYVNLTVSTDPAGMSSLVDFGASSPAHSGAVIACDAPVTGGADLYVRVENSGGYANVSYVFWLEQDVS